MINQYEVAKKFIDGACKDAEGEWTRIEEFPAAELAVFLTTEQLDLIVVGLKILGIPINIRMFKARETAAVRILILPEPYDIIMNIPGYFDYWSHNFVGEN